MSIALILAFMVAGGASFTSHNVLSRDTLHPIKVLINQGMKAFISGRGGATFTPPANTSVKTKSSAGGVSVGGVVSEGHNIDDGGVVFTESVNTNTTSGGGGTSADGVIYEGHKIDDGGMLFKPL